MSTMQEYLSKNGPVLLEAFGHQVGGHSLLMKFEDWICKPLLPRERFFYESIPPAIKNFTPTYYGVVRVCFEKRPSGEIQLLAYPTQETMDRIPGPLAESMPLRLKCSSGETIKKNGDELSIGIGVGRSYKNPWSEQCIKNTLEKLRSYGDGLHKLHQDYVVLEDLTLKFQYPCVLDLKVGTRQHGDDITEEKRKLQAEKCAKSTSQTLGVRICGMQMYDASKNMYIYHDKYYGRALSKEGFYDALKAFLHNGICFRVDILPRLIAMLIKLRETVRKQDTYRFFSSSLLLIYDGKDTSLTTDTEPSASPVDPDSSPYTQCRDYTTTSLLPNHFEACHRTSLKSMQLDPNFDLNKARQLVDVRMIDFAHTTHEGYVNDRIQYTGPDEGYIVGLNTLIAAFEELLEKNG